MISRTDEFSVAGAERRQRLRRRHIDR